MNESRLWRILYPVVCVATHTHTPARTHAATDARTHSRNVLQSVFLVCRSLLEYECYVEYIHRLEMISQLILKGESANERTNELPHGRFEKYNTLLVLS